MHCSGRFERTIAEPPATFSVRWMRAINRLHEPYLENFLHPLTQWCATNPKKTILGISCLSLFLVAVGLFTGFYVEENGDNLWTPTGVRTVEHRDWIRDPKKSGYASSPRSLIMFIHADGETVLTRDAVAGAFEALDTVRTLHGYDKVCEDTGFVDPRTGEVTCEIFGPTKFWNESAAIFAADTTDIIATLSARNFPEGTRVPESDLYGFPERDESTDLLTSVLGMTLTIDLPGTENAKEFEKDAIDALLNLADSWDKRAPSNIRLEVLSESSFDDEIAAAIVADIPLVPAVFIVMSIFTSLMFLRAKDPIHSRGFLGFAAVVSTLLAIMSGFGLMFISGIAVSFKSRYSCLKQFSTALMMLLTPISSL